MYDFLAIDEAWIRGGGVRGREGEGLRVAELGYYSFIFLTRLIGPGVRLILAVSAPMA